VENGMKRRHFWALPLLLLTLATGCLRVGSNPRSYETGEGGAASSVDQKPESPAESGTPSDTDEENVATAASSQEKTTTANPSPVPEASEPANAVTQTERGTDSESVKEGHSGRNEESDDTTMAGGEIEAAEAAEVADSKNDTAPALEQQSIPQVLGTNPMWKLEFAPPELEEKRSSMTLGVNLSQGASFVPANGPLNPFQASSTTHLVGTLNLSKTFHRFSTRINYKGGGNFNKYSGSSWSGKETQALVVREDVTWKRATLTVQDTLNGYAGGSFGLSAFGGDALNTQFGGGPGSSDLTGADDFSGLGTVQHVSNTLSAFLTEEITPRSGLSVAGAYSFTHYFGIGLVDNQQITAFLSYNREFSPRTNVFLSYAYQYWKFAGSETSSSTSFQLGYTHQLTPRLNVSVGAGPAFTFSQTPIELFGQEVIASSRQKGFNANGGVGYTLRYGTVNSYYEHLVTNGSGLFTAANTDIISANMMRPLSRFWTATISGGFVRLSSVANQSSPAVSGSSFQYGFAGISLQRTLSRHFSVFASYQFDDQTNSSACTVALACGTTFHTALLSVSWHANPIRLGRYRGQSMPIFQPGPTPSRLPVETPGPEEP
jgi:hypothetical protein